LHLACQLSNVEAARILLTNHDYDINILLYEKNFIYDLLTTGGYQDFNILNNVFKKRKPCINSGCKIPINQAILRGNQYIIQTMLEHGNPNPYAKDINGFTPVHFACAKLDWETFEDLIKIGGDPLLPDHEGNTFMHLLCEGGIKDIEYDFAKMACQQFNLRLTRNNNGKSALDLLGSMRHEEFYERSENLLM
jgi:ankyrin repeat protein